MVNLDLLMDKTMDFMIGGELIKVNEPSIGMVKRFSKIEDNEDGLESQINMVVEILNNNTSAKKFTRAQLDIFTPRILKAIINEVLGSIRDTDNNPN